jgi:hypothetical protein
MDNKMLTANYLADHINKAKDAFLGHSGILYSDNDDKDVVHAYLHLESYAPAHSIYEVSQHEALIKLGGIEYNSSYRSGESYLTLFVSIEARYFENFCQTMTTVAGVRGMELYEHATHAELTQYDRHCAATISEYKI